MSGNFLSFSKDVKDPFKVQEGRCDFPQDAATEKGLISPGGESLLVFLCLRPVPLAAMTSSCGLRKGQSPCELQWASRDSSPVGAGS